MRKHILQNKKITMIVNEEDGTFQIQTGRTKFLQQPPCAETDAAFLRPLRRFVYGVEEENLA